MNVGDVLEFGHPGREMMILLVCRHEYAYNHGHGFDCLMLYDSFEGTVSEFPVGTLVKWPADYLWSDWVVL